MMEKIAPEDARAALDAAGRAEQRVADEVGLPRVYWWGMAAGWVALGTLGVVAPVWLAAAATVLFGMGHSILASRLLGGRRRTRQLQVSATVAGPRTPFVVVGMLLGLVAITAGVAFALEADGASHPAIWAVVFMGFVVGFGGPEILRTLRHAFGA
jgi:4-hydroxybenzoate polyprenyltransferase